MKTAPKRSKIELAGLTLAWIVVIWLLGVGIVWNGLVTVYGKFHELPPPQARIQPETEENE